ncbi:hypothetical protein FHP25_24940 [Vineibacter terrae]|uniref:DUF927 domain-containing protein n=1 Tax=Vineibacter terrae TaxID=2586908 RepID=A0A5C8PFV5_9HYPH|nr:hypothetical protein [Vineibacter terrae]TXL72545.1 hypothetical protein FHP25_24940 [Vineibacter terrae]
MAGSSDNDGGKNGAGPPRDPLYAPDDLAQRSTPPPDDKEPSDDRRSMRTADGVWFYDGAPDPCPVRALGFDDGVMHFISARHEYRKVSSSSLPRVGVIAELFGGDMSWPMRHFWRLPKRGGGGIPVDTEALAVELIWMCGQAGQFDTSIALRGPGVWDGPDGVPIVHCGDVLIIGGRLQPPGMKIGTALYRSWAAQQRPATVRDEAGVLRYDPASADVGQALVTALGEWRWSNPNTEPELFAGVLAHSMLGNAVPWHCHVFVRAQSGAGKSTLLRLADATLGAGSHGVLNNVTAAYIQSSLSLQARAICLDEYENDTDEERLRRLTEMIRLMSDTDGGRGGRSSGGGDTREIRLSGSVIMAATMREAMRPQDLNRITMLRALKLYDQAPADDTEKAERAAAVERIAGLIDDFGRHSPALRARMVGSVGLYRENARRARATLIGWGTSQRDATQLGHLVAGFWTLTGDDPADDALCQGMRKYLDHLPAAESDVDDDMDPDVRDLLNVLFATEDHLTWSGGSRQTIGQIVARARDAKAIDAHQARERLPPLGLRLIKGEDHWAWSDAWLAVANTNKHKGLLKIFEGTPYRNGKWAQVLEDWAATSAHPPLQYAGVKSRGRKIPSEYLPTLDET